MQVNIEEQSNQIKEFSPSHLQPERCAGNEKKIKNHFCLRSRNSRVISITVVAPLTLKTREYQWGRENLA